MDVPTCKNIVLARVINSMTEFKQIIGRGTRVRDDYGKFFFNILDYTGSATRLFADPDFDGDPAVTEARDGRDRSHRRRSRRCLTRSTVTPDEQDERQPRRPCRLTTGKTRRASTTWMAGTSRLPPTSSTNSIRRKAASGGEVHRLHGEKVRSMYPSAAELRTQWGNAEERAPIIAALEERGITFEELAEAAKQPDADPFDLLCHVAFNAPLRTRRERAEAARQRRKEFFEKFTDGAREVLDELLEKYVEYGTAQFQIPDILKVPPISEHGNVMEIASLFGGRGQTARGGRRTAATPLRRIRRILWHERQRRNRSTAIDGAATWLAYQVLPRHHAQGQGPQRRPRPPADAHLDHVPEVPRRHGADPRGRSQARREEVPARHRSALPLARLGGQAGRHHRRRN